MPLNKFLKSLRAQKHRRRTSRASNGTETLEVRTLLSATNPIIGDVDCDSDFDANDSFLIHLVQLAGTDSQIGQSKGNSPLSNDEIRQNINDLDDVADVDGDSDFDANDSFLIHLVNLSGSDQQVDQAKGSSPLSASAIRSRVTSLAQRLDTDVTVLREGTSFVTSTSMSVNWGQQSGTRTVVIDLEAAFDLSDTTAAIEDLFQIYLINPNTAAETLLGKGPTSPVFSLAGNKAEFQPGVVRFDGSTVRIDVTSLGNLATAELRLQLINSDSDNATSISIFEVRSAVSPAGIVSPVFDNAAIPIAPSASIDIGSYNAASNVEVFLSNVVYSEPTGMYSAELTAQNLGEAVGRKLAVSFPNLPNDVTFSNASGTDAAGNPYINLASAIGRGGLATGASTQPVTIQLANPNNSRFSLLPTVLSGGANTAPTLSDIKATTAVPGDYIELLLGGFDADGDALTYSLASPNSLPNGMLTADGRLVFAPGPGQQGTYAFTVTASDGVVTTSQSSSITVQNDPLTTTRFIGQILNTTEAALAGLPIEIRDINGQTLLNTTTDSSGRFTLEGDASIAADTVIVRGDLFAGSEVYPFIAEKLPLVLGHEFYAGAKNVMPRPIYLPALDVVGGTVVDPNANTTVDQMITATEMASVFVEAGTLQMDDGNGNMIEFDETLSITEVPASLTPAALPENLIPDTVVTIQPGEMIFTQPAPLTLPNRSNFPPGTVMDLWSINPETGDFDNVGEGRVSNDGLSVTTVSGGIQNSSWHFFAPPPETPVSPAAKMQNQEQVCEICEATKTATSDVELHSGAIIEAHSLASYQSLGGSRGVTLHYNSERADPRPIVHFGFDNAVDAPDRFLAASLSFSRGEFETQVPGFTGGGLTGGGFHFWDIPIGGGNIEAALQGSLRDQPSGIYDYEVRQGLLSRTDDSFNGSLADVTGKVVVVNAAASPFGAGWQLGGQQQIVENPDGSVLLIDGNGGNLVFEASGTAGVFDSPPGDFTQLVKNTDGTFTRTTTDQTVIEFNGDGWLISVADRNGNTTQHIYTNGNLTKIIDSAGLETVFAYAGGRVSAITDPAGRITELKFDSAGNLRSITDPDDSQRQFGYDNQHGLTTENDQLGNHEQTFYGFHGRATRSVRKDGTGLQFEPVQTQALAPPEMTSNPDTAPIATLVQDETVALSADANGNVTRTVIDQQGQAVSASDSEGELPTVRRNSENQVISSIDGRGAITNFEYDENGNVISIDRAVDTTSVRLRSGETTSAFLHPSDIDIFTIAATAGDDLLLSIAETSRVNTVQLSARVYGPDGQQIDSINFNNEITLEYTDVALSGIYTLVFFDPGTRNIGTYNVTAVVIDEAAEAGNVELTSGELTSADLVNGDIDTFTITATAGDDLLFSIAETSPGNAVQLSARVYGPDGLQIDSVQFDNATNLEYADVALSGVYTLVFFDPGTRQIGTYNVTAVVIDETAEAGNVELTSGELTTADLVNGDIDTFTITVTAGDDLLFSIAETSPGNTVQLSARVYGPDGLQIDSVQFDNATNLEYADAALSGIYTLVFFDPGTRQIGTYNVTAVVIDDVVESDSVELNSGELVSTTLSDGDIDTFTVDISTGDSLSLSITETSPGNTVRLSARIYDSNGQRIETANFNNSTTLTYNDLSLAGPYTLVFFDPDRRSISSYEVRAVLNGDPDNGESTATEPSLRNTTESTTAAAEGATTTADDSTQAVNESSLPTSENALTTELSNGATLQGLVDSAGDEDAYSIDVGTGGDLFVSIGDSNFTLEVEIRTPDDSILETKSESGAFRLQADDLAQAGIYTVIVRAANGTSTGEYDLTALKVDSESVAAIGLPRTFEYDSTFNQLTSMMDELGRQTLYEVDPTNGNRLSETRVVGELDGATNGETDDVITRFTYTTFGLVDTVTNPRQFVTDFDYDALGRLTSVTFAVGTADQATQSFEYDAFGNQNAIVDEEQNRSVFVYDVMNRLKTITEPDPDGASGTLTSPVTNFTYDARGNLLTTTDARNNLTTNHYDVLDRIERTIDADDEETVFAYDEAGNLESVTDPLGFQTRNEYDGRNRLVETIDPDGGITSFEYDFDDNLTSLMDPVGNETRFVYDARDRMIREVDPLGAVTGYSYDAVDNLIRKVDRNGRITAFSYDNLDRLATETWLASDAIAIENTISYGYDKSSNLESMADDFSALTFTYDARDRVETADNIGTPDAPNVVLTYTYDGVGNVKSVSDTIDGVAGATTGYDYDAVNRTVTVQQTGTNVSDKLVDFVYNELGQFDEIVRYSDLSRTNLVVTSDYNYDELNRLTDLDHTNSSDAVLAFYDFEYDPSSRITKITDVDGVTGYTYDDRSQLTGADRDAADARGDESYEYDANGNRVSSQRHGDGYVTGPGNRLESDGTYSYKYDAEGNMIRRTEIATNDYREFTWDHRYRLAQVTDFDSLGNNPLIVQFRYDAVDRRIAKHVSVDGEKTGLYFVYDREDVLLDFVDTEDLSELPSPTLSQRYLHGRGTDQVLVQENGRVEWLLPDQLGTIRSIVSSSGAILSRIVFDSYGNVLSQSDDTVKTRYSFTGREVDVEIDMIYYRARYYSPTVGRFMQSDPIGFNSGHVNLYSYVSNSPLNSRDPSGTEEVPWYKDKQKTKARARKAEEGRQRLLPDFINEVFGGTQERHDAMIEATRLDSGAKEQDRFNEQLDRREKHKQNFQGFAESEMISAIPTPGSGSVLKDSFSIITEFIAKVCSRPDRKNRGSN